MPKNFILSAVLFISSFAQAELPEAPRAFDRYFSISSSGEIQKRLGSNPTAEISVQPVSDGLRVSTTKNETTAWFVGSKLCSQNKEFKCVSVYERNSAKSTGNQQSLLNKNREDTSSYTLYQMNPKNSELNSVVKCDGKYTTGAFRDQGDLSGCLRFTKQSCETWNESLKKNKSFFSKLEQKGAECDQMFQDAAKLRKQMKEIFQQGLKESEKEISSNFDDSTRDYRSARVSTKVELKLDSNINPNIVVYKDLFDRIQDCEKYADAFVSDLSRSKAKGEGTLSDSPAKKSKSNKVKVAN